MSKDKIEPQAFPYSGIGDDANYSKGMTLRDYFAAAALQGMYANRGADMTNEYRFITADMCYAIADAMLHAKETS